MAEQPTPQQSLELQRINWAACLPFLKLFGTFRLAIQPGKLGLALAAVLLTMLWGGFLDGLWSARCQPPAGEVHAFWQKADIASWRQAAQDAWPMVLTRACQPLGIRLSPELKQRLREDPEGQFEDVLERIRKAAATDLKELAERLEKDGKKPDEIRSAVAQRAGSFADSYTMVEAVAPRGVFRSFMEYESAVGRQLLNAAITLNFTEGLTEVLTARASPVPAVAALGGLGSEGMIRVDGGSRGMGVLSCAVLAARGKQWLLSEHFWFAILWGLPVLAVWALFGGAICRMAALNIARDERPSPKSVLRFAQRKLASFFVAPLLPLVLILLPGVVLFLGGLLASVPYLGDLGGGILAILALAGGLLIAVVIIGGSAGASLMWPTIAVEGSDGFDAVSRGYSYVFARPWRAAFYAGVLTVYGAICYLFVRFCVLLGLMAARFFVGAGMGLTDRPGTGLAEAGKIDVLWPAPTWEELQPGRLPIGVEGWDSAAGFLLGIWLAVVIALLCAFAASFFLSGSTMVYCLLRREVDATDYEEVFLEEDGEQGEADLPFDESGSAAAALPDSEGSGVVAPRDDSGAEPARPADGDMPSTGEGRTNAE
ncbi:MAG TPA: hypothetical protein VLM89_01015 [Phycisphaerae bacterium]|nr:hypothetical protein [Phycisphaerae bacterium]